MINMLYEHIESITLREKRPNAKLFLVRIFLYSVRIQENKDQKKLRIWTFLVQCYSQNFYDAEVSQK